LGCGGLPAAPVAIIIEIVLARAGHKDLIPGLGPGKFIADFSHDRCI
jgi:hypothetical protein